MAGIREGKQPIFKGGTGTDGKKAPVSGQHTVIQGFGQGEVHAVIGRVRQGDGDFDGTDCKLCRWLDVQK